LGRWRLAVRRVVVSEPRSVWRLGAQLGEGPVWVERDQALWFTDIKRRQIHRYCPVTDAGRTWDAPGQCGFVLPAAGGGFVAGLKEGLHRFDPEQGSFAPIIDPEPERPGNRLNDATVDRHGRLWFGTMDDGEREVTGAIYRLHEDGRCLPMTDPSAITNGPAVSPDGRTLYHVDTLEGLVFACDLSKAGALTGQRLFARIQPGEGYPDGPTVDAEGCVWIGLYQGWEARRYSPAGELLESVRFPVANITKLAFGGEDLKTVFATTAAQKLSEDELAQQPEAGDLFMFRADVPGVSMPPISVGL